MSWKSDYGYICVFNCVAIKIPLVCNAFFHIKALSNNNHGIKQHDT